MRYKHVKIDAELYHGIMDDIHYFNKHSHWSGTYPKMTWESFIQDAIHNQRLSLQDSITQIGEYEEESRMLRSTPQ